MALDALFALRGLFAFIAFTELTTAARCLLPLPLPPEERLAESSFVQVKLFSLAYLDAGADTIVSHLYGLCSAYVALALAHLAVFTHYRPLASLAFASVASKAFFVLIHVAWFGTIRADHNLIFPAISWLVALVAVIAVPFVARDPNASAYVVRPRYGYAHAPPDENRELVTAMRGGLAAMKRRGKPKQQ